MTKYKEAIAKDRLNIIKEVNKKGKFIDINKYTRII